MPGNQVIPLPLHSSAIQSRLSIQSILSETTTMIFPLASRSFSDRLVASAMETPHLLYALLATSDSHARRRMTSAGDTDDTVLRFTNDAIAGLRAALANGGNAHGTAMTAMALCTNDVCNGNLDVFRMHLEGVRGMLLSRMNRNRSGGGGGDLLDIYLFKWFAALDVSAGLSLFHKSSLLDSQLYRSCRHILDIRSENNGYVDDICGYSLKLLPILAKIGELARLRYNLSMNTDDTAALITKDLEIDYEVEAIETKIKALPQPSYRQERSQLADELKLSHSAFIHTALIHLHRRVQLLSKDHETVRTDVRNILEAVSKLPDSSTTNILLLWPIFSAGCETDDITERAIIDERMSHMQSLGMGNFTRARNVLNRIWSSGTYLRWDVYLAESGVDLVLF
ncbi:transcription factor domain-containing protein [Aspergillus puulaauensis]|uniref:Fungal-specific transcription factor domain-containing protein n=1 Tax=Aspergillus puulaauensis TaxID=1220207 RepID=A0A7R8AK22_9EURO|nr:uncharacterized protein APUU_20692A [Aspergillus puulaauensis]BCS20260.1 hypothetical protein APUU_20692A [Aspergillus puulaauensis]